jgi:putative ABC transport system substrate-binding protein
MASRVAVAWLLGALAASLFISACAPAGADPGFTIGLVTNNPNGMRNVEGFRAGMAELGYVEGVDVTYIDAGEPLTGDELDQALEEMVAAQVDLIFTAGTPTGVAAHRVTAGTDIPVVFGVIADPLKAGVIVDLTEPGGSMTGVKLGDDQSRRLEWLIEIVPNVRTIFVPFNPEDSAAFSAVQQIETVAGSLGLELVLGEAPTDEAVSAMLAEFPDAVDAVFLVPDSVVNARLADFVALALARKLPLSGPSIAQVEGGALMSYGFVHREAGAQAARIAHQVLSGVDPGSIPVENTESYLAINLVTADAIGLDIDDAILRQAAILLRGDGLNG